MLANPIIIECPITWTKIATSITSGSLIKTESDKSESPTSYLYTYRITGDTTPIVDSEAEVIFENNSIFLINYDEPVDIHVKAVNNVGELKLNRYNQITSVNLMDSTGKPFGLLQEDGCIVTQTYLQAISEGDVENHVAWSKIGYAPSLTQNINTDIWSYAGTQPVYLFPDVEMGMEILSSDNTADIGTVIKTGTSTGGTTTSLIDSGVDFTATTAVAIGDCVILDKAGVSPEYGWVTAVATHELTLAGGFSHGGSGNARTYNVIDKSAKAGAHAVEINYLNGSYLEKREIIILNGTTVVPTVNLNIFRINTFRVVATGANGVPTGNLTLRHLSDTPVYSYIPTGYNRARNAMYTVPSGKTLYVTDIAAGYATSGSPNKEYARVTTRANVDPTTKFPTDGLFYPFTDILVQNVTVPISLSTPTRITEKTDIKVSVIGSANGVVISTLRGWLETNS